MGLSFRCAVLTMFALTLIVPLAGPPVTVLAQEATPAASCPSTSPEENAAFIRMYWDEVVWGDQGVIREMLSPDLVHHWGIGGDTTGIEAFSERFDVFLNAFPDIEFGVHQVVAQDNLVATRWTATATHSGEWQGIAPTGHEVSWNGINLFRIECGLVAEAWGEADHVGLRAKLGATDVPAWRATPTAAAATKAEPAATPCTDDSAEANIELARR